MRRLLSMLILLAYSSLAHAIPLSHFHTNYSASFKGLPVQGNAYRKLEPTDSNQFRVDANASSFLASREEHSLFSWQKQGLIQPSIYEYHQQAMGKTRDAILQFNWQNLTVINNVQQKPWRMAIPGNTQDKLSYQLQLRADLIKSQSITAGQEFTYPVADGGKLKHYTFTIIGEKWINTPAGWLNTVIAQRKRSDKKRTTTFWLAKEWEFVLVRLLQIKSGNNEFEINLVDGKVGAQTIKGLTKAPAS